MSVPNQIIKEKPEGLYTVKILSGNTDCMGLTVAKLNQLPDLTELRIMGDSEDCESFLRILTTNVTNLLLRNYSDNYFTGFEQTYWRLIYLSVVKVEQKQQPDETILSKLAKVEDELGIRTTGFECK